MINITSGKMKFLQLRDVSVKLKGKIILDSISCDLPDSKISAIIGRSGAGKSTLLKLITRFYSYQGSIIYKGKELHRVIASDLRKDIAYVGQTPVVFSGTVYENLIFPRRYHGMKIEDGMIEDLLEMVGLDTKLLEEDAKSLSVGQAQRLHLARTLANEPSTLLLDEPASALDVISKNSFEEMILRLKKMNSELTIVIVTHDLNQARNIADYLILLEAGNVILAEDAVQFFAKSLVGDLIGKDSEMLERLIEKLNEEMK